MSSEVEEARTLVQSLLRNKELMRAPIRGSIAVIFLDFKVLGVEQDLRVMESGKFNCLTVEVMSKLVAIK